MGVGETAAPPPPPQAKAGTGWRILAVVLGVVFAFLAAVMVAVMIDIGDTPYCDEPEALGAEECYGGSKAEKTIALILGWPSAVAGFLVLPLAIYFAARGVRGRLVIGTAAVALALGGLSILIG